MKTTAKILTALLTSGVVFAVAGPAAGEDASPTKTASDIISASRAVRRRLRQVDVLSIQAPETEASEEKIGLAELVDLVAALRIPQNKPAGSDDGEAAQPDKTTVGETQSPAPAQNQSQSESGPAPEEMSVKPEVLPAGKKTQLLLKALADDPQSIVNPLAIAEALFATARLADAAQFYQLALTRTAPETDNLSRPWILFQIGNCLKNDDHTEAYKAYEQLGVEYPGSHWTPAAKAQQQIIAWYAQNSSVISLEQETSDPNSI